MWVHHFELKEKALRDTTWSSSYICLHIKNQNDLSTAGDENAARDGWGISTHAVGEYMQLKRERYMVGLSRSHKGANYHTLSTEGWMSEWTTRRWFQNVTPENQIRFCTSSTDLKWHCQNCLRKSDMTQAFWWTFRWQISRMQEPWPSFWEHGNILLYWNLDAPVLYLLRAAWRWG